MEFLNLTTEKTKYKCTHNWSLQKIYIFNYKKSDMPAWQSIR